MSNLADWETRQIEYQRSHSNAAWWEAVALILMVSSAIMWVLLP